MTGDANRFSRIFWITAGIHVVLIVGLFSYSAIRNWLRRAQPKETVTFVSLHTPAPVVEQAPSPAPAPPAPPPPPPPPPRPPAPRVEPSRDRVRRPDQPAPAPAQPVLTPEQIRQRLARELPTSTSPAPVSTDAIARYYALIQEALYRAWDQPAHVLPGTTATARIRVQRDGAVVQRTLIRRSNNGVMDDSIQRALNAVSRVSPLPPEISGPHHDITIEFELTGARL